MEIFLTLALFALALVCAWNIGRLHAQMKVLEFVKSELSLDKDGNPPNVLTFIHKLINIL